MSSSAKLNPMMLGLTFSLLRERGMGSRRIQLGHGYLKSCLARAVEMGLLGTNPMDAVKRPKWTARPKSYWTLDQTQQFMEVCSHSPRRYAPLFLLLVTTGLRISEALALETGTPILTIEDAVVWQQGQGYIRGQTKTPTSQRSVPVPAMAQSVLVSIPFRTSTGLIPQPSILRATLAALCTEAGVPPITPHGLRHQHAALAYSATGDMYAVQRRLGHANVTTTMGMYGFGLRDDTTTRDALDAILTSPPQLPRATPESGTVDPRDGGAPQP
jgi:integrase